MHFFKLQLRRRESLFYPWFFVLSESRRCDVDWFLVFRFPVLCLKLRAGFLTYLGSGCRTCIARKSYVNGFRAFLRGGTVEGSRLVF